MRAIYSQAYPEIMAEMGRQGITLSALKKLLGVSMPTVQRKLSGQTPWTIDDVEKLCEILNKNYYELFTKKR